MTACLRELTGSYKQNTYFLTLFYLFSFIQKALSSIIFNESCRHALLGIYSSGNKVLTTDLHSMRRCNNIMKRAAVFIGFPKEKMSMSEP